MGVEVERVPSPLKRETSSKNDPPPPAGEETEGEEGVQLLVFFLLGIGVPLRWPEVASSSMAGQTPGEDCRGREGRGG